MSLFSVRDVSCNVQFNFNYNGDDTRLRIDFDFGRLYVTGRFCFGRKARTLVLIGACLKLKLLLLGVRDASCDVQFNCNGDNARLDVR